MTYHLGRQGTQSTPLEVPDMDEDEALQMVSDNDRRWILVEKMAGDMEAIKENVLQIPGIADRLERVEGKVDRIEGELVVHRHILKEHSAILKEHSAILGQHSEDLTQIKHELTGLTTASHPHV